MLPGGEGGRKGWLEVWDQHACTAVFEGGTSRTPLHVTGDSAQS